MRKPQVEGHWHSLIGGFATSSLDFYELVKAGIAKREIPDLKIELQGVSRAVASRWYAGREGGGGWTLARCCGRFPFIWQAGATASP